MKIVRPNSSSQTPEPAASSSSSHPHSAQPLPPLTLPPSPSKPPIVTFRVSCLRKTRRPQGLNVGLLTITEAKLLFTAKYLNVTPEDADVTIKLSEIHHARRAGCFKRLLPHGVLIKCRRGPDYLMIMTSAHHQQRLIKLLNQKLGRLRRPKRIVKEALGRLASDPATERTDSGSNQDNATHTQVPSSSPHRNPSSHIVIASRSAGSSERLPLRLGRRRKKSDASAHNSTLGTSDQVVQSVPSSKPPSSPSIAVKPSESEVQPSIPAKGFAFATDFSSQMVEMTLSVPIPDVSAIIEHVLSFRSSEGVFFFLATSFLLITTYGILSSVRMMSFRLALIKEMINRG
ncbi:unnamed protein product [Agarophyton chilense]